MKGFLSMKSAAFCFFGLSLLALAIRHPLPTHAQKTAVSQTVPGSLTERQQASLTGLRAVSVKIAPLPPAVEATGLHKATLQTDTEVVLKKAGIPVSPASNDAGLLITVRVRPQSNFYVVLVQAEVLQPVRIERAGAPSKRIVLPTWRDVSSGVLRKESLTTLRGAVGKSVAAFIVDYKAVNK